VDFSDVLAPRLARALEAALAEINKSPRWDENDIENAFIATLAQGD
jgi:hypothetical protein